MPIFIAVGGISGIGKTTIINELLSRYSIFLTPQAFTSREQRVDEVGSYLYSSKDKMKSMFEEGALLNIHEGYGNYYGILTKSYLDIIENKKIPIRDIHPLHFDSLSSKINNLITVYIHNKTSSTSSIPYSDRKDRFEDDGNWENQFKFDIIINNQTVD
ncbi:MAG: hypothetical protein M0D57_05015 [Sphingobacteriales bacterium JAD_PAG50586_3]|nr:MAG: hypothetical protein M0D57_05015 [Sphingobacteriales bacterium JAD_PAG50586_3]